jgi:hypothetical protein
VRIFRQGKDKAIPLQAWTEDEVPKFQNNQHTDLENLSAVVNIPGTNFC